MRALRSPDAARGLRIPPPMTAKERARVTSSRRQGEGLDLRLRREALRVASQHHQLDQFHEVFENALARGDAAAAQQSFARFADALEAHFQLEEQVYFPALHGKDALAASELAELVREHDALRVTLEDIHRALRERDLDACDAAIGAWLPRLVLHERREEALMAKESAL
jgi:iron-sulfur cluster repair protein YtfE (RIC family)